MKSILYWQMEMSFEDRLPQPGRWMQWALGLHEGEPRPEVDSLPHDELHTHPNFAEGATHSISRSPSNFWSTRTGQAQVWSRGTRAWEEGRGLAVLLGNVNFLLWLRRPVTPGWNSCLAPQSPQLHPSDLLTIPGTYQLPYFLRARAYAVPLFNMFFTYVTSFHFSGLNLYGMSFKRSPWPLC